MSKARNLASGLLRAVLRHAPAESREWARAMLRELDFIESDSAALFWALGSAAAVFKQASRESWTRLRKHTGQEEELMVKGVGKKITGTLSGVLMAGVLACCAYGVLLLLFRVFPSVQMERVPWLAWLTVIALPEVSFIICAVALWRKKRFVAIGVLLTAITLGTHFVMHIASHWNS